MGSSECTAEDLHWKNQLFLAVSRKRKRGPEIPERRRCEDIQECLYEDVDIDAVDENGDTVLHKAVEQGYLEVVKFLHSKKAKIEISNKRGSTALTLAKELGNAEIFQYLKESCEKASDQPRAGRSTDYFRSSISESSVLRNPSSSLKDEQIEEKYLQGGLTSSFHGNIYQLKHYMLILQRASKLGYSFRLAKEMEAADKMDDLVFEYRKENSTAPIHRFVQFKHRAEESFKSNKISANDLMNVDDGNFSLLKYFVSYRKINGVEEFSTSSFKDYVLCTNIDLDVGGLNEIMIDVDPVRDRDDFLKVTSNIEEKEPKIYRLRVNKNHDLYKTLKRASDIHRLAEILVDHVRESKKLTLTSDFLKQYHTSLAKEVLDVKLKRFKKDFVDPSNCHKLSPTAKMFREIFSSRVKKLSIYKKKGDNDVWKSLENFKFNLSETFGKGTINDLPHECVRDEEIEDFFKNFIIAVDQPNETHLTEIISDELSAKFNIWNADFTVDYFQTAVMNWFKEAGTHGRFLTEIHAEEFFDGIRERLSILKASGVSSRFRAELDNYDVKFDCQNSELIQFLNNSDSDSSQQFRLTSRNETLFLALIVHQVLKLITKYKKDDGCIFIRLEDFLLPELSEYVIRAFGSSKSHDLLIIDCSVQIIQLTEHSLWNDLLKIMQKNCSKKLILVDQKPNDFSNHNYNGIGFQNLDKNSRRKILDKLVKFQGSFELSWADLLGIRDSDDLEEDEIEDFAKIFNVDDLAKLIRNETIKIGEEVDKFDKNLENYYIDRIIIRHGFINKRIFEATEVTDLFAISGIFSGKLHVLVKIFQEIRLAEPRNRKCIWLDWGKEVESFQILCEENPNRNVHWLHGNTETLICKKSTGGFCNLVKYDHEPFSVGKNDEIPIDVWFEEDGLLNQDHERGIVVISDTAGMGKSTLLKKMSHRMKKSNQNLLVIRVELSSPENTRALDEEEKKKKFGYRNAEEAADFLIEKLVRPHGAASEVFKRLIAKLEGKSALLFDGFDEISPKYSKTVRNLLETLSELKLKKLIVTTRPHTSTMIEEKFGTRSHTLLPFSEDNQKTFLINFWSRELSSANNNDIFNENRLKNHAQQVINLLSTSINDRLREFTGIPLQTQMVAEVYSILNREDGESSVVLPSLPEKIDIIDLYGTFVDKKYDIYFEDKNHGNKSNQGQKSDDNLGRKISYAAHKKLALETFFDEDDVEALLFSQKQIEGYFDLWQEEHKGGERTGIITQVVDGKPRFVHRTFAEYFAALFLFDTLIDENRNQNLRQFFLSKFFILPEHETIRAFVNCLLSNEIESERTQQPWAFDLNEYRNKYNDTVYHVAAKERNTEIMRFFLNCLKSGGENVIVDIKGDRQTTALHVALLSKSHLELIKCLVDAGADVDAEDNHGGTPLREATETCNLEAVKYLLDKGAFIDAQDGYESTVLHYATEPDKIEIAKCLIDRGAKIDVENTFGTTPLYQAVRCDNAELAKYLIARGANIHTRTRDDETLLHAASDAGNIEMADYFINEGADVNSQTNIGTTPLLSATEPSKIALAKLLIAKGANIHIANKHGWTPLMGASLKGNTELVDCLMEMGGDIHGENIDGETPLHQATLSGNVDLIKLLIDRGADIHFQDKTGRTSLHNSARRDVVAVAQLLVEKGADIHAEDKSGRTPLYFAIDYDHDKVAKFFIEQGARIPIVRKPEPFDLSQLYNTKK